MKNTFPLKAQVRTLAPKAFGASFPLIAVALAWCVLAPFTQARARSFSKYPSHMPLVCSLSFRI